MRKGKVDFFWDVGSGVGRIEYPDMTIDDGFWYRIEASRQVHPDHDHPHILNLFYTIWQYHASVSIYS